MSLSFIITNANIINEGRKFPGSLVVKDGIIDSIHEGTAPGRINNMPVFNARGSYLLPGVIDCHVHFREPGLTYKADLESESIAAVAGGVTSFMEMPNTIPQTTTLQLLEDKFEIASGKSLANYSFFLGATNNNIDEIKNADPAKICGVKVFFGASTGNMLVDNFSSLEQIFRFSVLPVAVHCEDEAIIRANTLRAKESYGEDVPVEMHPVIRSDEACYNSTSLAVELAKKYNTRLHITHVSTAKELDLLDNSTPLTEKRITAETCPHYLWFSDKDYARLDKKIKVNPAIKTVKDKEALLKGLIDGHLDIVSTDHAPHLEEEKLRNYFNAPSGTPLVQHSLYMMLEFWDQGKISLPKIVEVMCHAPAICYNVKDRGFLRPGYPADMVLFTPDKPWKVSKENILYKCGWSALEGEIFHSKITHTWVNGHLVYNNGLINDSIKGQRLTFKR